MVEEDSSQAKCMKQTGESLQDSSAQTTLLTTKKTTRIGTWNILTYMKQEKYYRCVKKCMDKT
jgi:hypothetical protein